MTKAATADGRRVDRDRHDDEILLRLRKVTGQLSGVSEMVAGRRYCIDVLDQLAAVSAAVDAVALLLLEDHITNCVSEAIREGDADAKTAELAAAFRRYVRSM